MTWIARAALAAACALAPAGDAAPAADIVETALPAASWLGTGKAQLWLPPGVAAIRRLVFIAGVGHGNRVFADAAWRRCAQEQQWALLFLKHAKQRGQEKKWGETGGAEVNAAVTAVLATLAAASRHPELVNVPWANWGHSGGGAIAFHTMLDAPGRFFACLPYHGAVSHGKKGENEGPFWKVLDAGQLQVPILFLVGSGDIASITTDTSKQFLDDRAKGTVQAYVTQPDTNHLGITSTELQLAWLAAAYRLRVPAGHDFTKGPAALRDVPEAAGWLGDAATRTIAPFASFTGDTAKASWLPDEAVAKLWLAAHGAK